MAGTRFARSQAVPRGTQRLAATSRYRSPVVDRTYSLDDIVDAYRYVGSEQKLGTVAVTVA
jgi:hypothetical protein